MKLLISILLAAIPAHAQLPASISLDQAFQSALKKNETVLVEEARAEGSEARVSQARSAMLPNVVGRASVVRQSEQTAINGRVPRSQDQTTAQITAVQPLWVGGRLKAGLDQTKALNDSQKQNVGAARASLYVTVAQSYYEVLAAEADLKNLQTSVELTEGRIKELQRRARIGRSRTGEVLTNQSSLALQKANVQDAIDRLARARQNFAFQTGMSPISLLQTPVIPANSASALPALENYVAKIPERSDVRSLEMRAQAASSSTDLARAGHMPTLNLIGNGYWTKDARDGETQWDVGLGLTIPIFEGGAVQGRVREAKSEEIEAQLNLQRQKRAAESEIAQIHASLTNTLRQITSLEEAVTSSEKNYKEQTRDYSYGLVNNLDVLQAQNTLQETRRSLDRSRFLSLVYWAELKAAVYDIPEVTR